MESRLKVLFYGNSLVLFGMQAGLRTCPNFEVISLDALSSEADLLAQSPNVVIYDLSAAQSEWVITRLQAQPGLLLIGVDPERHDVLLTGQAVGSITLSQITQFMQNWKNDPEQTLGEDK